MSRGKIEDFIANYVSVRRARPGSATYRLIAEDIDKLTTVLFVDRQDLYNNMLIQLYIMTYPFSSTDEGEWLTKEEFSDLVGESNLVENFHDIGSAKDARNRPLSVFKNEVKHIRTATDKAFDLIISSAKALVNKDPSMNVEVKAKGRGYLIRLSSTSNNARSNKYNYAANKIFKSGQDYLQSYFNKKINKGVEAREKALRLSPDPKVRGIDEKKTNKRKASLADKIAKVKLNRTPPEQKARTIQKLNDEYEDIGETKFSLFNLGHMYASGRQLKTFHNYTRQFLESIDDPKAKTVLKDAISSVAQNSNILQANAALRINWEIDTELTKEHIIDWDEIDGVIYITLESAAANTGVFSQSESSKLREFQNELAAELSNLANTVVDLEGSPSIRDDTKIFLVESTVGMLDDKKRKQKQKNKLKGKKSKGSVSEKGPLKETAGFNDAPRFKFSKRKKKAGKRSSPDSVLDTTTNLVNIQAIINEHLPIYLKKNMGKGRAKQVLNWRTGRFANSAVVKNLQEIKGSRGLMVQGMISYLRRPYDVFRPGGRLHRPGRDPQKLINKSIRQILKEKALTALSFRSQVV